MTYSSSRTNRILHASATSPYGVRSAAHCCTSPAVRSHSAIWLGLWSFSKVDRSPRCGK
jgi:hypothetical protein